MVARFVPATGWGNLLPWYDPAVAILTGERHFKARILAEARFSPGQSVLDVGCGTGTLPLAALESEPTLEITGLDIDSRILAQAKRKHAAESIRWLEGTATSLPCESQSVDRVLCSLLFHHLNSEEKCSAAAEFQRVLKPTGKLLFADYGHPLSLAAKLQFLPVRLLDGWNRTLDNVAGRIPKIFSEAGFSTIHEFYTLPTLLGTVRCYRVDASSLNPNP